MNVSHIFHTVVAEIRTFFSTVRGFNTQFWFVMMIHFFTSYARQLLSATIFLVLTEMYGYTDHDSSIVVSLLSLSAIYFFFTGAISDHYDLFLGLTVSNLLVGSSILLLLLSGSPYVIILSLVLLYPIGNAFGYSFALLSVDNYSDDTTLAIAFGIMHAFTQLPQLFAFVTIAIVNRVFETTSDTSSFRLVIILAIATGSCILSLSVSIYKYSNRCTACRCRIVLDNPYLSEESSRTRDPETKYQSAAMDFLTVIQKRSYLRQIIFILTLTPVAMLPYIMDVMFLSYAERNFGRGIAPGLLSSINPLVITLFAPIIQHFTSRFHAFYVIMIGVTLSVIGSSISMAGTIPASVFFFIIGSIGEATWNPRVSTIIMRYAPKINRGTYNSLVRIPNAIPQFSVGFGGGQLLANYCPPDTSYCNSLVIWGITTGVVASTLVFHSLAWWKCSIYEPISKEEDAIPISSFFFIEDDQGRPMLGKSSQPSGKIISRTDEDQYR